MRSLRAIGYWKGPNAPTWPSIERFISPLVDRPDREAIAAALDGGIPTDRTYMGFSECRLCGCANGSGERTNGTYVWPEGLSHYVRDHHVRLPHDVEFELLATEPADEHVLTWASSADDSSRDYEWWRSITDSA